MASLKLDHTRFLNYAELENALRFFAEEYDQLCRLYSIGKSSEGRNLWLLELTNYATGPAKEKPGYYIDGNHHAGEVTGSAVCLYTIEHLLTAFGVDSQVNELLNNVVFYILPRVSPDGAELYLTSATMLRSSPRTWIFPEPDSLDGLYPEDIDGDGHILTMRVRDDDIGEFKLSEQDHRLLVRRGPDDKDGPFYRLYSEGRIRNYDGYEVKQAPNPYGLDFNRNYPMHWRPETGQRGAGPYPFSEPETRAVGEFLLSQKNIAGALSYHTSGGVILRPLCTGSDSTLPMEDRRALEAIGNIGHDLTGYPCISIYEGFTYDKSHPSVGSFIDFAYDYLGITCYATELWDINAQAGLPKRSMAEIIKQTDKEREQDALGLLKWNDEVLAGQGFVNWREFDHPELGKVEIGGWLPKTVRQNPPASLLKEECEKNMRFSFVHAAALPRLVVKDCEVIPLGEGCYRLVAVVENAGYLPTSGSAKAAANKVTTGAVARLSLPEGGRLLSGLLEVDLGHLSGFGSMTSGRTKVEWVAQLPCNSEVVIQASAPRAGTVSVSMSVCSD